MPPFDFDPVNDGYWGDTTSSLDWCEDNYAVSWYIAEWYNSVTNLAMVIPACYGLWHCWTHSLELR